MSTIPNCQINDWLIENSPEFRDAVAGLSPKCWARYDLSAVRVGWELARMNTHATDAELERLRAALDEARNAIRWALGEVGDWPNRADARGNFYWRSKLRKLARLRWDGEKSVYDPAIDNARNG